MFNNGLENEALICRIADSCAINTLTTVNFKIPTWWHQTQSWEGMSTQGSPKTVGPGPRIPQPLPPVPSQAPANQYVLNVVVHCFVAKSCPTLLWLYGLYVAHQASWSIGFSRQKYSSVLKFSSPGTILDPWMESMSSALAGGFFTTEPSRKPRCAINKYLTNEWKWRDQCEPLTPLDKKVNVHVPLMKHDIYRRG